MEALIENLQYAITVINAFFDWDVFIGANKVMYNRANHAHQFTNTLLYPISIMDFMVGELPTLEMRQLNIHPLFPIFKWWIWMPLCVTFFYLAPITLYKIIKRLHIVFCVEKEYKDGSFKHDIATNIKLMTFNNINKQVYVSYNQFKIEEFQKDKWGRSLGWIKIECIENPTQEYMKQKLFELYEQEYPNKYITMKYVRKKTEKSLAYIIYWPGSKYEFEPWF